MPERVIELEAKSALNRAPEYMGIRWTLNPYRGCQHGCVYCYARYTHTFFDLNPDEDFTNTIFVKINIVPLLRRELRRPSWRREPVLIGTATDPYQPLEGRYRLMPGILQALSDFYTPFSIITKNTMILRDADLLARAAQRVPMSVTFSITTVDPALADDLEPDTPPPAQRLRVAQRLRERGVPAGIAIAPIVPGITDGEEHLRAVIAAAVEHGLPIAYYGAMRLYDATRPTLFAYLETHYPKLISAYRRGYVRRAPPREYRERLYARVEKLLKELGATRLEPSRPEPVQPALLPEVEG